MSDPSPGPGEMNVHVSFTVTVSALDGTYTHTGNAEHTEPIGSYDPALIAEHVNSRMQLAADEAVTPPYPVT